MPGLFSCDYARHPRPTLGQRVALLIENDLYGRGEFRRAWADIDHDARDEIRDKWAGLLRRAQVAHDEATYFPPPTIPPMSTEAEVDSRLRALGYELDQDGVTWRYIRH